jgi:hypothetical protein
MILLYKTGLAVFDFIARAVWLTLSLGHVNVKKVFGER